MTDFYIFKDAKSLPGISNLFGISQAIERRFNTGFPGLHSPGDPYICRCENCTQAKIKRIACINCSKTRDSCNIHFKNEAYLLLKSANTAGLSDIFCRYV